MTRSELKIGMRVYDPVKRITGNVSFVGFLGSETHCLIEGESLEIVAIKSLQECSCGTCARLMGDKCKGCENMSLWIRSINDLSMSMHRVGLYSHTREVSMQLKKTDGSQISGAVVADVAETDGADKLTPDGLAQRKMEAIVSCMCRYRESLDRIDLHGLDLAGGQFIGMGLNGADFSGTDLSSANFHGANLNGANFSGANLYNTIFKEADLRGANLSGAKIHCTDFRNAKLDRADFIGVVIAEGHQ